jgi:TonB family protein
MKHSVICAVAVLVVGCASNEPAPDEAPKEGEVACEVGNLPIVAAPPVLDSFDRALWIGKRVEVQYDVIEGGMAENIRVAEGDTTPEIAEEAQRAVAKSRFKQVLRDGKVLTQKDCRYVVDFSAGLRGEWVRAISDKVKRNWTRPPNTAPTAQCKVQIDQSPQGEILNVALVQSCGSRKIDDAVVNAVRKSSPLPAAPDPAIFEATVILSFVP